MSVLFNSGHIGSLEIKNRFVRSATWEGLANDDGSVTDSLLEVYRNLARGGVGLIMTGYSYVSIKGKCNFGMIGIDNGSLLPGLQRLTDAVHKHGSKIFLQVAHGGSQTKFDTGFPAEAPSVVKERFTGTVPVEMSMEDIRGLIDDFSEAGRRAKKAGFDGVEIHSAHGYLLSQFLSPYSNRRLDQYGGPIENRARVVLEVYEAIRGKVGKDFPISIKINCEDFDGVGLTPEDSRWVCKELSEKGVDAIHLSGGLPAAGELTPARMKIAKQDA